MTEIKNARLGMIWAQTVAGAIGKQGDMPWHLPEDLKHFKDETMSSPVIMGRLTWESLPEKVRPLPGRKNIVVTRASDYKADGAHVVHSVDEALKLLDDFVANTDADRSEVSGWVLGGGQIYEQAMQKADLLVVTKIILDVEGADTFAPQIPDSFKLVEKSDIYTSKTGLGYFFEKYERNTTQT